MLRWCGLVSLALGSVCSCPLRHQEILFQPGPSYEFFGFVTSSVVR